MLAQLNITDQSSIVCCCCCFLTLFLHYFCFCSFLIIEKNCPWTRSMTAGPWTRSKVGVHGPLVHVLSSPRAKRPWRDKILGAPQRGQKIIVNQSKPILVIVSIKPFTCQSFRQNYFSREIEWAVFTETDSWIAQNAYHTEEFVLVMNFHGMDSTPPYFQAPPA